MSKSDVGSLAMTTATMPALVVLGDRGGGDDDGTALMTVDLDLDAPRKNGRLAQPAKHGKTGGGGGGAPADRNRIRARLRRYRANAGRGAHSQSVDDSKCRMRASSKPRRPSLLLAHHYAAQDPGFRKRFSYFVLDQLMSEEHGRDEDTGGGREENEKKEKDDLGDNAAALTKRIRRVGSYGHQEQKGIGPRDGGAETMDPTTMLNGGYGLPVRRRRHHNSNGVNEQAQPADRVTTIKLDNLLLQIGNAELSRFLRRERRYRWLASVRRIDPRYQILTFFNDVSREGGENVGRLHQRQSLLLRDLDPLLHGFVRASAFSVWRPTSRDAIHKMMRGEAVGKGLDVKGKSARRGGLSGFIPFVQIHAEADKRRMRRPPREGRVRVYFQSEGARNAAREELTGFAARASRAITEARQVIQAGKDAVAEDLWERALEDEMMLDVEDIRVFTLDDYSSQGRFGLDVPERYFVEVAMLGRDISRPAGSEWDVGRNSEPAFQDMNSACIRAFDGAMHRAVILQMDDSDPLRPQTLVVAYEEHGRVIPVASDFDAFLVGTRGVNFHEPLPADQVSMMADMIEEINSILSSPATMDSWTARWLEVLKKKADRGGEEKKATPQYGYGDPKSYDMMEAVARRVEGTSGAVRHGAECFNLIFPQEIDESYLVVCDSLPGKIPWKYVDVHELQDILCERIEDGFAFPLNPKWVLCDSGWKKVWDKLIASDNVLVQQSMDMWYPPASGIRERIEEIYRNHPSGFQLQPPNSALFARWTGGHDETALAFEGTEAMDLAEQDLRYYKVKQRAKTKLRAALMFQRLPSSATPLTARKAIKQEETTLPVVCKAVSLLSGRWYDENEMV